MNLFDTEDYKKYILAKIEENTHIKGYRSQLAEQAGCHRTFLSQALHSHVQLTPDHGAGLAAFWGFDDDHTDYFLDLIHLARAASKVLSQRIRKRMRDLRARHENLTEKFHTPALPRGIQEAVYYSSWHYAAIHIVLGIPQIRTVPAIAARLGLPSSLVEKSLAELSAIGVVRQDGSKWLPESLGIHLPKTSPLTSVNHFNWRQRAIYKLQTSEVEGVHYTGVFALARADAERIKRLFLDAITSAHKIVEPSKEEELVCLNCDFFVV